MDLSQSASHLLRKQQSDDANGQPSPWPPQPFPDHTVVPPPAYTPAPQTLPQLPCAYFDPCTDDERVSDDDECYDPPASPITVRIDAPLKIIGHANIVCPDTRAMPMRLASTIVGSIQRTLAAAGNTEKARPLDVTVGCGITIVGSKNIVSDGMTHAFTAKTAAWKMEMERNASSRGNMGVGSRKRRAESVSTTPLNLSTEKESNRLMLKDLAQEPPGVQHAKEQNTENQQQPR